jgi:hypothetical protein
MLAFIAGDAGQVIAGHHFFSGKGAAVRSFSMFTHRS